MTRLKLNIRLSWDSDKPLFPCVPSVLRRIDPRGNSKTRASRKARACLLIVIAFTLACLVVTGPSLLVHATSPPFSQVYISPIKNYGIGVTAFTVDVDLNLTSGQVINGFDVRINYTNPHSGVRQGVLSASRIDYSTNIFSSYGTTILEQCIDGVSTNNGSGCTNDVLGQVRLGEFVLGRTLPGPLSGRLFSVTFQVMGSGNSTLAVDLAAIVNPTPDQSNPTLISPQNIPVIKRAAIFTNAGATAFFDFQPDYAMDTLISPVPLPNNPVTFDASNSLVADNASAGFKWYYWNFGDGTILNVTSPVKDHTFRLSGNYTVSLTVADEKGQTGSISRTVTVSPALGNIDLTVQDQGGTAQSYNVVIHVFNTSSSRTPFFNVTINGVGQANIIGLTPGTYYLTFSGPTIISSSKTETALAGYTLQDTIHVSMIPSSPDYSGLIYLGTILGGLATIFVVRMYQKTRSRRLGKTKDQTSLLSKSR